MRGAPPRTANFYGMRSNPQHMGETWLEPEELCYPHGGQTRRCRARCPDGKLRIIRCGIPDTYFSIPCRGGFISVDTEKQEFIFTPTKKEMTDDQAEELG